MEIRYSRRMKMERGSGRSPAWSGFHHIAAQNDGGVVGERVDHGGAVIRHRTMSESLIPSSRRWRNRQTSCAFEKILVDFLGRDGHVLLLARVSVKAQVCPACFIFFIRFRVCLTSQFLHGMVVGQYCRPAFVLWLQRLRRGPKKFWQALSQRAMPKKVAYNLVENRPVSPLWCGLAAMLAPIWTGVAQFGARVLALAARRLIARGAWPGD